MKLRLLLVLVCGISLASNAQSFREQFIEANLLSEDGYYGVAIPIWRELLKERNNANINYKLGSAYLNLGIDRDRALPFLIKASKDIKKTYDPFSSDFKSAPVETYYYLAQAYHIRGKIDSSEFYYNKFLDNASKKQYLRPKAERGLEMCETARELMKNPVEAKILNIGAPINSPYAEYSPIVAYDENTLYFTSRRFRADGSNEDDIDARTGRYYEDMYVSFRSISGNWMEPELLNINVADQHSSVVSMSPDGRRIYIYKTFSGNGNIYESEFILGTGWTEPELVGSNVNSEANEFFATITADDQRLYFVSDREGGYGGKDIWYSQKLPNGEWGKAINAGATINTAGDEDAPYIHPDGKTMYFSSNGHKSMGGYDIFYTQFIGDSWTPPENLGYPINTTDDDHSYISTPDGNRAYYSSKGANTLGSTDIYVVEYQTEEDARPEVDLSVFALVKGWVFPAAFENLPADLKINIINLETNEVKGEAKPVERNGSFVFIIPAGESYNVTISIGESQIYKERIDIPEGKVYQELSREIYLPAQNSKRDIVAINDDVLGKVIKWQIISEDNTQLPLGSKVYYLNDQGDRIDSSYVSKDGYFEYKKLDANEPYRILPVLSENSDVALDIKPVYDTERKLPELTKRDGIFYETGALPNETAKAPSKNSKPSTSNSVSEKPDTQKQESKTDSEQPKKLESKNEKPKKLDNLNKGNQIIIEYNFNVASDIPTSKINEMVSAIEKKIATDGKAKISLIGSASTLHTNRKGGNEELAALRLSYGKAALMKALEEKGVDMNKISTISENTYVSGPRSVDNPRGNGLSFVDYQYFMIIFN